MIEEDIIKLASSLLHLLPPASRSDELVLQQICNAAVFRRTRMQSPDNLAFWTALQRSRSEGTLTAVTLRIVHHLLARRFRLGMSLTQVDILAEIDACLCFLTNETSQLGNSFAHLSILHSAQRTDEATIVDLRIIMAVLEYISNTPNTTFRKIADHLERRPQALSEAIERVEDQLGLALFEGTTTKRKACATMAGEELLTVLQSNFATWDIFAIKYNSLDGPLKKRPKKLRGPRSKGVNTASDGG